MSNQASTPSSLSLYQTEGCPFCVRVRIAIERLGVEIEFRDVNEDPSHLQDLVGATGQQMVPCLRIEKRAREEGSESDVQWMHESADIIAYLQERFG